MGERLPFNPYDLVKNDLVKNPDGTAGYLLDDRVFLDDLISTILVRKQQVDQNHYKLIIDASTASILHLQSVYSDFFSGEILGFDGDEENPIVEDRMDGLSSNTKNLPASEAASYYIAHLYGSLPILWEKLSDEDKLYCASMVFLRIIGEEQADFGIVAINEYINEHRLPHVLLDEYHELMMFMVVRREIMRRTKEVAFNRRFVSSRDYRACKSADECIVLMQQSIREYGDAYESPSLDGARKLFAQVFGIYPGHLRYISLSKGWDLTTAQLRNAAEVCAGVRFEQNDQYRTIEAARTFMTEVIRRKGDTYRRPRVKDVATFTDLFKIHPRTLCSRIAVGSWDTTVRDIMIAAERDAGLAVEQRKKSVVLDGFGSSIEYFADIIRSLGTKYRRPSLNDGSQFYRIFGIHRSTLGKRARREGWPTSSIANMLMLAEEKANSQANTPSRHTT